MFGLSSLAAQLLGAAVIALAVSGTSVYFTHQYDTGQAAKLALKTAQAETRALTWQAQVSQQIGAEGQKDADAANLAYAQSQTKIQTVTKTLIQQIPQFIAPDPVANAPQPQGGQPDAPAVTNSSHVVCGLSNGFVLVHDAAAINTADPAALPGASGLDRNAASGIGLPEAGQLLSENYGAFWQLRDRAAKDEAYIVTLKSLYDDLVKKIQAPPK